MTKEVNGRKRDVVMDTDVTTGRQTIKMRFSKGVEALKERLLVTNGQRPRTDVWEREDLAGPGHEGQSKPAPTPKGKDKEKQGAQWFQCHVYP